MKHTGRQKEYRWYHGALFLTGITLLERGLEKLTKKVNPKVSSQADDKNYYRSLRLPPFAPPAKAFPIAWVLSDLAIVWGNLRVLNKPTGTPGRREFLVLQVASWSIYTLFTALHFGLRSPINALALTSAHAALNAASESIAITKLKDKKVALSLIPVLTWLSLALPTAIAQAAWNKDRFYQKGPLLKPGQSSIIDFRKKVLQKAE